MSYYYSTTAEHGTMDCHIQINNALEHIMAFGFMYTNVFPVSSGACMVECDGELPVEQLAHMGLTTSTST